MKNKLDFGLLCTNEEYWFCKRIDSSLFISLPLKCDQTEPTVIGALCYLSFLAAEDRNPINFGSSPSPSSPNVPSGPWVKNSRESESPNLFLPFFFFVFSGIQRLLLDVRNQGPASQTMSLRSLNADFDEELGSGGTGFVFAGSTPFGEDNGPMVLNSFMDAISWT